MLLLTVTNDLSADQRMIRIATALAEAGHDVCLVGRQRRQSLPLVPRPFRQHRLRCRFEQGKLFYIEYNLRLLAFLLTQRFHALCAVDLDTILPCLLAARLRGRPCVYDAHEYFTEVPEVVRRPRIQAVWAWVGRVAVPRVQAAYTVGPALAVVLSGLYGIPFGVVRNVPFAAKATPPAPEGPRRILLYQGMLNEGRGLEQALHAMTLLPHDTVLWLAGEGDRATALRQLAQDLGLGQRVRFLGFVPPDQLPALTAQAHVGLNLLAHQGQSYYYSLANKAFDYVQAALPSVQMDFPEYRSLNAELEVFSLLPDLGPQGIAQALRRLLHDDAYYEHLRQNCLAARQVWHWEREREALLALWGGVVGNREKNSSK